MITSPTFTRSLGLFVLLPLLVFCRVEGAAGAASDRFYQPGMIQEIHIDTEVGNLKKMKDALPERVFVPATFRWGDVVLKNVAIRYKGNSSSNPNQQHKRSFLIKFDEWAKDQRFLGLRRVPLDNGVQFGSVFSEPIVTSILREEGIIAPRCNHAKLYINNEYMGVYVNVERIDRTFVARHFPKPEGALYKIDMGGPGCDLNYLGDDPARYGATFEPKTDAASDEMRDVIEFIRKINQTSDQEFSSMLASTIDVDAFLKTMAVMLFSGAFDQLTGWNPHNYYLYHGLENDQRWNYLPWDLDVGFSDNAFNRIPVIDGWNAAWPVPAGASSPLLKRIVDSPELLKRYREFADKILEKHFKPSKLNTRFDGLYSLLEDDLNRDPFPHRRITNPTDRNYESIVRSIKAFVERRYETARQQLDRPEPRPAVVDRPREKGPEPGTSTADAPTDLRVVSQTRDSVTLTWKDNANGEVANVVQRSDTARPGDFQNHFAQPGDQGATVTVGGLRAGQTYFYRVYAVFPTPDGPRGTAPSESVKVTIPAE